MSLPIISGRVTTDVYWSALAFMSDYVVCRLLDDKIRLVKSWMFLLSESLCAWILLLWILSDVTQGSILFGAGFCLVIFGWAVVGMIIEAYGFILLFRYVICLHHICKFLNLTLTTVANVTLVSLFVTPTIGSWWSQWGVIVACHFYSWWKVMLITLWVTLVRLSICSCLSCYWWFCCNWQSGHLQSFVGEFSPQS